MRLRCPCLTRRFVTLGLSAAALAACSENAASGRSQLAFVPDDMLAQFADQSWRAQPCRRGATSLSNE